MQLNLTEDQINFILEVLQSQPLPFVRTAPVINSIGQQIVAAQSAKQAPLPAIDNALTN